MDFRNELENGALFLNATLFLFALPGSLTVRVPFINFGSVEYPIFIRATQ